MDATEFGPVELVAIAFEGHAVPENVIHAMRRVPRSTARLLDLIIVTRGEDGALDVAEYEAVRTRHGLPELELDAIGLAAEDDAAELAADIPPGSGLLVVAFEQEWLRGLVTAIDEAGGVVVADGRIPAAVVNEIVEAGALGDSGR